MKQVSIIFIGIITVLAVMCVRSQDSRMGQREIERWETRNNAFKIRVIAHPEEGGFVAGAYYVFQSAAADNGDWRDIMIVHHDDPVKIPRQQVRFLSDRVGYAFMLYSYAVTIDAGASWSVWYAPTDLPQWLNTRANIANVLIFPDGTGTMSLRTSTDEPAPELHTRDFGKHWMTNSP
ncbi:MAG TPA: hypothetical protein VGK82_11155 [Pyrinomonadaceae bacterium]